MFRSSFALLFGLMAIAAIADDHAAQELQATAYGQAYALEVSNPTGVVTALTRYKASSSSMKFPGNILLNEVVADGESRTTHQINVFFPSASAMDQMAPSSEPNADGLLMFSTMQASAEPVGSFLFTMERGRGALSEPGNLTLLIALQVTDVPAFTKAFDRLWNSEAARDFPGGIYFGSFLANGDDPATHWVSFVAQDMATLTSGMDALQGSSAMAAYLGKAEDFRKVTRTTLARTLLALRADSQ